MPDWENLVQVHLRGLDVDANRAEEIASELAGHLEEVFSECRRGGMSEAEATRRALDEIPNWKKLCSKIRRANLKEDDMTQRTKSLWIPGAAMLALALAGLTGAFRANMYPYGLTVTDTYALLIYVPWLASLPLIGALGTYCSWRLGGNSATRLRACLIPIAVLAPMFLISTPVTVFWIFRSVLSVGRQLIYLASCALHWVVYPSLALLLGALPFLFLGRDATQTIRPVSAQN